jgi:hypothetical protein
VGTFHQKLILMLCALRSSTVVANVAFTAGAAAGSAAPRDLQVRSPSGTVITAADISQIEAEARQIAAARLRAEGLSPARNKPRIGWFIPVDRYCLHADEQTFQDALQVPLFDMATPLDNMSVRLQKDTYIKLNAKAAPRIPDIYYFRLDKAHPTRGLGYLSELKVGNQSMGRAARSPI